MINYWEKNILVLAPHTDDGELGCGATLSKLIRSGAIVHYIAFSSCEESIPEGMPKDVLKLELLEAMKCLGVSKENTYILNYRVRHLSEARQQILDDMIYFNKLIKPDLVFLPSLNDIHQDHQTIAMEGLRAFKKITMLAYELPWNNYTFNNQAFFIVDEIDVKKKIEVLSCYKSQMHRDYTQSEYLRAHLNTHGVRIGTSYAEVFEVPRIIF